MATETKTGSPIAIIVLAVVLIGAFKWFDKPGEQAGEEPEQSEGLHNITLRASWTPDGTTDTTWAITNPPQTSGKIESVSGNNFRAKGVAKTGADVVLVVRPKGDTTVRCWIEEDGRLVQQIISYNGDPCEVTHVVLEQ